MLTIVEKISFKQRQIIIHSYLYYHRDTNIIPDSMYDRLSYKLEELIKQYPVEFKQSEYYSCFKDWSHATGFDLYDQLSEEEKIRIHNIADYLTRYK